MTTPQAAPDPEAGEALLSWQSREDTDIAWGEYPVPDDDERLERDRPPHWDDF